MEKGVNKMSKFRSYNAYNTNFNDISVERRAGDKIAEVNRNVNDLHSDILRIEIMCQAMMEIMVENGIDPDVINSKIYEIMPAVRQNNPRQRYYSSSGNMPLLRYRS